MSAQSISARSISARSILSGGLQAILVATLGNAGIKRFNEADNIEYPVGLR
jgi:hypothetical protein